jgi:hypothetical protein
MRTFVIVAALIAPAVAHADVRQWSPTRFDRIESAGSYDVTVVPGPTASVRAEGDRDTLAHMRVGVDGSSLTIGAEHGWHGGGRHQGRVHVTVTAPTPLREASLAGSGNMTIARVEGPRFKASIAGSGDMTLRSVAVRSLSVSVAGSGTLAGAGHADEVSAEVAGSGDVRLGELRAADLTGDIAGSGNIVAYASRNAKLSIMGSGDARVRGGARCTVSRMGSGRAICTA